MNFDESYLTDKGRELAASTLGGLDKITFTHAVASSHDYSSASVTELKLLTDIEDVKQSVEYSHVTKKDATTVSMRVDFPSKDVSTPYSLYTVGFYARPDNGDEILYAVLPSSIADYIPAYDGHSNITESFTTSTTVSDADNVMITVSQAGMLTEDDLEEILTSKHYATEVEIMPTHLNETGFAIDTSGLGITDYPRFVAFGYYGGAGIPQTTEYAGVETMMGLSLTVDLKDNGQLVLPKFKPYEVAKYLPDFDMASFTTNVSEDGHCVYLVSGVATIGIQCLNATFK